MLPVVGKNGRLGQLIQGSVPRILYFRSDSCTACRPQSEFLSRLQVEWTGRFLLEKIDADLEPEKAHQFQIMTLPTTILVDQSGSVKHINYGLTSTRNLGAATGGNFMTVLTQIDPEAMVLSHEEVQRYSRHLIMPEVGMEGQKKIKAASVLLIGAGGLGSPLAMYLAAAGVGRIGMVDYDIVDYTNLQRQIIHGTSDVGRPKLVSARERILEINPHVQVDSYEVPLTSENALELFAPYDVIIDGTDNFPTRYLTNDACVLLGKPNVYGSIFRFEGQVSIFHAEEGPCYRCLYP